jgi:hypothetical protein
MNEEMWMNYIDAYFEACKTNDEDQDGDREGEEDGKNTPGKKNSTANDSNQRNENATADIPDISTDSTAVLSSPPQNCLSLPNSTCTLRHFLSNLGRMWYRALGFFL